MKRSNLFLLLASAFALLAACSASPADDPENPDNPATPPSEEVSDDPAPVDPQPDPLAISSVEFAGNLGAGWNLGNQLDAYVDGVADETSWGNPRATLQLFLKLKEYGFKSVRIPVTWLGHVGDAPDFKIDSAWLDRVAEVVGYAEQAGLFAVINIHHDGAEGKFWLDPKGAAADAARNEYIKARLYAMWSQIAVRFADKGQFLIFESLNEIHDGGWGWGDNRNDGDKQYMVLNEWNQTFVDAVRAAGGANEYRFLGVPGYCTNPDLTVKYLRKPVDSVSDRILVAVHFYDPSAFSIEAKFTEWGHTAASGLKESWGDEDHVKSVFLNLYNSFAAAGTGIYVGEWGATRRANDRDESFRLYYISFVAKVAAEKGIPLFFWDNGSAASGNEAFGIIRHSDGAVMEKGQNVIKAIMQAFDPALSLETIYNSAPR